MGLYLRGLRSVKYLIVQTLVHITTREQISVPDPRQTLGRWSVILRLAHNDEQVRELTTVLYSASILVESGLT